MKIRTCDYNEENVIQFKAFQNMGDEYLHRVKTVKELVPNGGKLQYRNEVNAWVPCVKVDFANHPSRDVYAGLSRVEHAYDEVESERTRLQKIIDNKTRRRNYEPLR